MHQLKTGQASKRVEVEITSEMTEAGVRVWDECYGSMDEFQLLERVYTAMYAVASGRRLSQISPASSDRVEPVD